MFYRVLSYNIHKGFSSRNKTFILKEIRDAIRGLSPDFVFLQEVLGEHEAHRKRVRHWPNQSQFEYMADAIWPHYAYGRNAIYDEGHHGNAILSKYPILEWENQDVSTSALESRGLLHAIVQGHRKEKMHLICAHFGLFEKDRQVQARRLCARIRERTSAGIPLIVAGDFNDWKLRLTEYFKNEVGLHEAYYERHQRHARTFPSNIPLFRLDRVYYGGRGMAVANARCLQQEPWPRLSDHAPLLVDFRLG